MRAQQPEQLLPERCSICGAALVKGRCPRCHRPGPEQCVDPQESDCDCPVVGYIKLHAPWCKYY